MFCLPNDASKQSSRYNLLQTVQHNEWNNEANDGMPAKMSIFIRSVEQNHCEKTLCNILDINYKVCDRAITQLVCC